MNRIGPPPVRTGVTTAGTTSDEGRRPAPWPAGAGHRERWSGTLRGLTAAGVLLSAVVHLELWAVGMGSVPVIGPAFLLNAVGGLVIAVAVLVWRHWLPLLAAVGFGVATLVAFVVSVTVGLFGVQEAATGTSQTLAAVAEVACVVFALAVLVVEGHGRRLSPARPGRRRPGRRPARSSDDLAPGGPAEPSGLISRDGQ